MTHQPQHPESPNNAERDPQLDAELDALLSEEAITSRQTPEQLEAKVLALTDPPPLLSLLDEAPRLKRCPASCPIESSRRRCPSALAAASEPQRAVLARIEPSTWRCAAAAAIVLAAGVGLWLLGQQKDSNDRIAKEETLDPSAFVEQFYRSRTTSSMFEDTTLEVQAQLQSVSNRIDSYAIDSDTIWSDMDDYEQFLSELETTEGDTTPAT